MAQSVSTFLQLAVSECKREFQRRFQSKCYAYIFLNLPRKRSLEIIPFILIPEQRQSNTPLLCKG